MRFPVRPQLCPGTGTTSSPPKQEGTVKNYNENKMRNAAPSRSNPSARPAPAGGVLPAPPGGVPGPLRCPAGRGAPTSSPGWGLGVGPGLLPGPALCPELFQTIIGPSDSLLVGAAPPAARLGLRRSRPPAGWGELQAGAVAQRPLSAGIVRPGSAGGTDSPLSPTADGTRAPFPSLLLWRGAPRVAQGPASRGRGRRCRVFPPLPSSAAAAPLPPSPRSLPQCSDQ